MICKYCRRGIDKDKEAYSYITLNEDIEAWHYMCYINNQPEVIKLTRNSKIKLIEHLRGYSYPQGWMNDVLISLGCVESII